MLILHLPARWSKSLIGDLERAGNREIGGILMGEQLSPGNFRVVEMTFQRHGGNFAFFVRNARLALTALQVFFSGTNHQYSKYNYLGEWHSHPSFKPKPSSRDHDSMIDVACHQNTGANFVVLMIVRLNNLNKIEGSTTTYLPNGSVESGKLIVDV